MILMQADALQLHRAVVEEKALRGVETERAETDRHMAFVRHLPVA